MSRSLRAVAYTLMVLAGAVIVWQEPFGMYYKVMGVFCVVGGLTSALGAATDRWGGEYVGLPLISTAMLTFAGITIRDVYEQAGWLAVPSIALLVAFGGIVASRWIDVLAVRRAARDYADARAR